MLLSHHSKRAKPQSHNTVKCICPLVQSNAEQVDFPASFSPPHFKQLEAQFEDGQHSFVMGLHYFTKLWSYIMLQGR